MSSAPEVIVKELFDENTYSVRGGVKTRTRVFHVSGAWEPEHAAEAPGIPQVGARYFTTADGEAYTVSTPMKCVSVEAQPDGRDDLHKVTCTYEYKRNSRPSNPSAGDEFWTLDLSGQQINKKNAYVDQKDDSFGSNPPVVGTMIGVSDDGSVAGVDVYVPGGVLSVTAWKSADSVTPAFVRNCMKETGHYNGADWYGFQKGEMLFTGVRIQNKDEALIELEYNFLIQPNETSAELPKPLDAIITDEAVDIGVRTNGVDGKLGWEYMWSIETELKDLVSGRSKIRCKGLYIAQVYKPSTFAALGLSGAL